MRKTLHPVILLAIALALSFCKQDTRETKEVNSEVAEDTIEVQTPVESPEVTRRKSNSVMARIMGTSECNLFSRYLVTAQLSDSLLLGDGPYTVFAPENDAFDALDETFLKELPMQQNREELTSLLRGHIIQGNLDSASIAQQLQIGSVTLETLSGSQLRLRRSGSDILLTDEQGRRAKVGKSDILGENGIVHVIDKVLRAD